MGNQEGAARAVRGAGIKLLPAQNAEPRNTQQHPRAQRRPRAPPPTPTAGSGPSLEAGPGAPAALRPSAVHVLLARRGPGWIFLRERPGASRVQPVGAGSLAAAAEMEAPTLQGQADVTKAKQTPCHTGYS